jgi:hypothetical protein
MAQLSLKITAETDDPVWHFGRGLVSALQRRARAEGVEIVFTFQVQNEGHLQTAHANAVALLGSSADESSAPQWIVPGFQHRCRCGRRFRFHCRADCRGPEVAVGAFANEGAPLRDAISDRPRHGERIDEKTRDGSWDRMRQILEQRELGVSYSEIAKNMGVSRQRVRQLHGRALELRSKGML